MSRLRAVVQPMGMRRTRSSVSSMSLVLVAALAAGCGGDSSGGASGTGGAPASGSGGASGTGGAPASGSGGGSGTGGAPASGSGGASGTGGAPVAGSGGASGSGGRAGTGGAAAGPGGASAGSGGAGAGGVMGTGGARPPQGGMIGTLPTCMPQSWDAGVIGWASVGGGTTGGGTRAATMVSSVSAFNTAAGGTAAAVIHVMGRLSGTFTIGSNKTIIGTCGAELSGHVQIGDATNVIVRNLRVVGRNCTDNSDCESGADAISVEGSDHVWFDHMDVLNGSDGNLDITSASDYVTVSWSKFYYSGLRAGAHQYSNLVGSDDGESGDAGHLRVTWHHNWWGMNVGERMPRVRFGQNHIFSNLYTASGNNACIQLGVNANLLIENNFFMGVEAPIETASYSNAASIAVGRGNVFRAIVGMYANKGTAVFTPPYAYAAYLDDAEAVSAVVMGGAGVK